MLGSVGKLKHRWPVVTKWASTKPELFWPLLNDNIQKSTLTGALRPPGHSGQFQHFFASSMHRHPSRHSHTMNETDVPLDSSHLMSPSSSSGTAPLPFRSVPRVPLRHFLPGARYFRLPGLALLDRLRQDFGPLLRLDKPGEGTMLLLFRPEDTAAVFQSTARQPSRGDLEALLQCRKSRGMGAGLALAEGEEWRTYRELAQRVIGAPQAAIKYVSQSVQAADMFIDHLRSVRTGPDAPGGPGTPPDTVRNFQAEAKMWSFESMGMMVLGTPLGIFDKDGEAARLFSASVDMFQALDEIRMALPLWRWVRTPAYRRLCRAVDTAKAVSLNFVREALQAPIAGSMLASVAGEVLTEEQLEMTADVFSSLLIGAVDTTSVMLTYLMHCLATHPACQERARREVLGLLPDLSCQVTPRVVGQLAYLKACLKEAIRLHHVAIGTTRVLTSPLVLSGYEVPAGVKCAMLSCVMSMDPASFADPQSFRPERWLRSEPEYTQSNRWAYLPFGHGPRSCIGRRSAELEAWVTTAQILRHFQIATTTPKLEKVLRTVIVPEQPVGIQLSDL